jgi:hypothetical protein
VPELTDTVVRIIPVPTEAVEQGYDRVQILPKIDDNLNGTINSVGYIRFLD